MTIFRETNFKGEIPLVDPSLLKPGYATLSLDCFLDTGAVRPVAIEKLVKRIEGTDQIGTILLYENQWLAWKNRGVKAVRSPRLDDSSRTLYWTGDTTSGLRAATYSDITSGSGRMPRASRSVTWTAPTMAPSAITTGTPTSTPNNNLQIYIYTYVNEFGEETSPSTPGYPQKWDGVSWVQDPIVNPGETCEVTVPKRSGHTVRVYRTAPGGANINYYFVREFEGGTFTDTEASVGEPVPSNWWLPPPAGMFGITQMHNGWFAALTDRALVMSEPTYPHAWPYERPIGAKAIACGQISGGLVVATDSEPWLFVGSDPRGVYGRPIKGGQACLSSAGVVSMNGSMYYPSPDGLTRVDVGGASIVTRGSISRNEWQEMNPSRMIAHEWRGGILLWSTLDEEIPDTWEDETPQDGDVFRPISAHSVGSSGSYSSRTTATYSYTRAVWFSPSTGEVIRYSSSSSVSAVLTNTSLGDGYVCNRLGNVNKLDGGESEKLWRWRTRTLSAKAPWCPGCLQIIADDYTDMHATILADGLVWHEVSISSREPVRLPSRSRHVDFQVEVRGKGRMTELILCSTPSELGAA